MTKYVCWVDVPTTHPFDKRISDCFCGYLERKEDDRCKGCRKRLMPNALEQLQGLDKGYTEDGYVKPYKAPQEHPGPEDIGRYRLGKPSPYKSI